MLYTSIILAATSAGSTELNLTQLLAAALLSAGFLGAIATGLIATYNRRADTGLKKSQREKVLSDLEGDRIDRLIEDVKELKQKNEEFEQSFSELKTKYQRTKELLAQIARWAKGPSDQPFPISEAILREYEDQDPV